jgi:hypothetical protein
MQGAVLQIGASIEQEQQIRHESRAAGEAAVRGFVEIKIAGDQGIREGEGLAEGEA